MADPKQFVLIGSFDDRITPSLVKVNSQIAALQKNITGLGKKGAASRSIGKIVSANKNLSKSFREVQSSIHTTTGALKKYVTQLQKVASANKQFQRSGQKLGFGGSQTAREMRAANRAAQQYLRTLQQINKVSPRASRSMGGGGLRGGGGRGVGGGSFDMASFGFAYTLGSNLSRPIEAAILSGFRLGVQLMVKPFQYFVNNFGERVQDELSDLKAAGGFFSIAKGQTQGEKLVKTFDEAIDFTQDNNKILAKIAASLPGVTQDYIDVSKRISDSVARVVVQDKGKAIAYAQQLQKANPDLYKAPVTDQKGALQVLLADLTKQTVLAGLGGRSGAGGAKGAYGLPGLTERMLSQDQVSIGQFQRYSAIFSDPMVMDALQKEIPNVNKAAANSIERYKAIEKLFKRVVPPELVERYRRTVSGVVETFNTAIFGPETGLFGLGRKMDGLGDKFDEFGRVVKDASGKVVKAELSLYDLVRDVIANLGQVFAPFVENITKIFDPLRKLGEILARVRTFSAKLLESFNIYLQGFKDIGFEGGEAGLRASLTTIGNLLRYFKVIGEGDFAKLVNQLKGKDVQFGPIMKDLLDKLLNSEVANNIGKTIGEIIGTVLSEVANLTGFVSGRLAASNRLFAGLRKGFDDAGGVEAIRNIFRDVLGSVLKLLGEALRAMPAEIGIVAAVMAVIPALAQAVGMWVATQLLRIPQALMGQNLAGPAAAAAARGGRGRRRGRYGAGGSIDRLNRMRRYKMGQVGQFGMEAAALGYNVAGRPGSGLAKKFKMPKVLSRMGRAIPGGALAMGAMDVGLGMASGQSAGKAIGGAVASTLGAAVGSIFGPIGTVAGGILGGMAFDYISSAFDPAANAMKAAAKAMDKYSGMKGAEKAGGIEAVLQNTSAENLPQMFRDLAATGKLTTAELKKLESSGFAASVQELETINKQLDAIKKEEARAEQLNLSTLDNLRNQREALERRQQAALDKSVKAWESFGGGLQSRLVNAGNDLMRGLQLVAQKIMNLGGNLKLTPTGVQLPSPVPTPNDLIHKIFQNMRGSGSAKGSLGSAISSEMKNKPRGSHLVIANSSETVIPAAGGYGMKNFLGQVTMAVASANRSSLSAGGVTVNAPITINQQPGQNSEELAAVVAQKLWDAVAGVQRSSMYA